MKVVLAHGSFDLLHYGHILMLRVARSWGDKLIVTITADKFIRKGVGRPIFTERQRLDFIKECRSVDEAYIVHDETGVPAILKYKPNIYAKGSDTIATEALRRESYAVEAVKGEIRFIDAGRFFHSSELLSGKYIALREDQES